MLNLTIEDLEALYKEGLEAYNVDPLARLEVHRIVHVLQEALLEEQKEPSNVR